jgi:hypothetical protein
MSWKIETCEGVRRFSIDLEDFSFEKCKEPKIYDPFGSTFIDSLTIAGEWPSTLDQPNHDGEAC